jgi:hypothetical protein
MIRRTRLPPSSRRGRPKQDKDANGGLLAAVLTRAGTISVKRLNAYGNANGQAAAIELLMEIGISRPALFARLLGKVMVEEFKQECRESGRPLPPRFSRR